MKNLKLVYSLPRIQISRLWSFLTFPSFIISPQGFGKITWKNGPNITICILGANFTIIKILVILNLVWCLFYYFKNVHLLWDKVNWTSNTMFNNSMPRHGLPCQGVVFTKQLVKGRMRFFYLRSQLQLFVKGKYFWRRSITTMFVTLRMTT